MIYSQIPIIGFQFKKDTVLWKVTLRKGKAAGLEWPKGFQEVKVSRLHDNGTGWW
jgi:hypothetical protein